MILALINSCPCSMCLLGTCLKVGLVYNLLRKGPVWHYLLDTRSQMHSRLGVFETQPCHSTCHSHIRYSLWPILSQQETHMFLQGKASIAAIRMSPYLGTLNPFQDNKSQSRTLHPLSSRTNCKRCWLDNLGKRLASFCR